MTTKSPSYCHPERSRSSAVAKACPERSRRDLLLLLFLFGAAAAATRLGAGHAAVPLGKLHHREWPARQPRLLRAGRWQAHLGRNRKRIGPVRKRRLEGLSPRRGFEGAEPGTPGRAVPRARQTHRRRVGRHHGRTESHLGRAHRHFYSIEFRTKQQHRLRGRGVWRLRVDGDCRRRQPPEHAHRAMVSVQQPQHPHVRNLDLRR